MALSPDSIRVLLVAPLPGGLTSGNRITADRWAGILQDLGCRQSILECYEDQEADLLIALHARRSFDSIRSFKDRHPDRPVILALTGTDIYHDLGKSAQTRLALELADRIVVLQRQALQELPSEVYPRVRVIYQSAKAPSQAAEKPGDAFQVCLLAHLRPEKDPFRIAEAVQVLPAESCIRVIHAGGSMNPELEREAVEWNRKSDRYRWIGGLPFVEARRLLASSHLLVITSRIEGSSNALSEALVCDVPVVAAKIPGLIGTLGEDYPGYFPVGDAGSLRGLLLKAERVAFFYRELEEACRRLAPLASPAREREAWRAMLREIRGQDTSGLELGSE